MYIAMNRFKVVIGLEGEFEEVWRGRDSRLSEVPGFLEFRLLRGKANVDEGYTLFSSHTTWLSEEAFINWTKSEHFRAAHRNAGDNKRLYWGPPQFEGFSVVAGI
ncbi:antibiotic biosynthesis monooxygenase [Rhizobium sp. P44RR-XXIV]|uniref:antibiotic biosynthesis monooxygenase family protein n=1 Tax=Rhizobium sp. P44RR-XXIV TaxID=1921145 RepID=UPI0009843779|nr:antibiotic biosynthesis monooxygenase [Rhizobium sp. P44RR-XXIV]TIX91713.1 antibiotic biosynthesis monooxygenase [Rhizobium sp. P44RR-XXIV]